MVLPRVSLARLPTPIEKLKNYSEMTGMDVWVKRDDLTGSMLSGNKIRKLEFLLADALHRGHSTVVTCGGWNSNHCRATAYAARQLGLEPRLVLRTDDGRPRLEGNAVLSAVAAEHIRWVDPDEYDVVESALRTMPRDAVFYPIPSGGSTGIGAFGYSCMVEDELFTQLNDSALGDVFDPQYLVHAVGSGGTSAGLAAGKESLSEGWDLVGFTVGGTSDDARKDILRIIDDMCGHGQFAFDPKMTIIDDYAGKYGVASYDQMALMRDIARSDGLLLDPSYTGKAFYGMHCEILKGRFPAHSHILFLHTGGGYGNFGQETAWARVLNNETASPQALDMGARAI